MGQDSIILERWGIWQIQFVESHPSTPTPAPQAPKDYVILRDK